MPGAGVSIVPGAALSSPAGIVICEGSTVRSAVASCSAQAYPGQYSDSDPSGLAMAGVSAGSSARNGVGGKVGGGP